LTTRKITGENRQDLENLLGLESTSKNQFLDKVRVLVIMILCLKDLDLLQKLIEMVPKADSF